MGAEQPRCVGLLEEARCSPTTLPLGAVVLATEDCHLLVVQEGHAAQRPPPRAVHVAADVFRWGVRNGGQSPPGPSPEPVANYFYLYFYFLILFFIFYLLFIIIIIIIITIIIIVIIIIHASDEDGLQRPSISGQEGDREEPGESPG